MKTPWRTDDSRADLPWKAHPGQRHETADGQKWELFHRNETGRALVWVPVDAWSSYVYRNWLRPKEQERHPAPRPRRTLPTEA